MTKKQTPKTPEQLSAKRIAEAAFWFHASGMSYRDCLEELDPKLTREEYDKATRISGQIIGVVTALVEDGDLR